MNQNQSLCSFIGILQVPTLLDALPRAAVKNLSSTCRSLRPCFCARVKIITLANPTDVSKLCRTAWPQLMMVVCTSQHSELKRKLSADWECVVEISISATSAHKTVVLVRSNEKLRVPLIDLSSQQYTALSDFADKHRHSTRSITLRGPPVGSKVMQSLTLGEWPVLKSLKIVGSTQLGDLSGLSGLCSLTSITVVDSCLDAPVLLKLATGWSLLKSISLINNQLDANAISAITQANWLHLQELVLNSNKLGIAGIQHLVCCSWPVLKYLTLEHTCIDGPAVHCLAQGQWPALRWLSLDGNNIGVTSISYLLQGNWPLLRKLVLCEQGLDEEAYTLLGIPEAQQCSIMSNRRFCKCSSDLPQFPNLIVWVRNN